MTGTNRIVIRGRIRRRMLALERAQARAQNPEFKKLWAQKKSQLLNPYVTLNVPYEGDILNGWPTDGEVSNDPIH
jgi:hypothetical protein